MVAIRSVALYVLSPAAIYLTVPAVDHIEHVFPAGVGRWSGLLIAGLGIAVLMVTAVSHLSYRRRADVLYHRLTTDIDVISTGESASTQPSSRTN